MRGTAATALAAVLVLLMAGCGDDAEKPEVPQPGPLTLTSATSCTKSDNLLVLGGAVAENTADIPLTIDEVTLHGGQNVELVAALVRRTPAIDATIPESGLLGSDPPFLLKVRVHDAEAAASFTEFTVDYHNVEGRFRAVGDGVDVSQVCRR